MTAKRFLEMNFLKPFVYSVFLRRAFGAKLLKRALLTTTSHRKFYLITEKLIFCILFFSCSSFAFFCLCFVFLLFLGGFKGQVRWPDGPHLARHPPSLFWFLFRFFKVQMRWPKTSLGPRPSFAFGFVLFCFLFVFVSLFCFQKKACFPPSPKGHFCLFSVSPLFVPSFFTPPFHSLCFLFSLSLSRYFLVFFLPCFLLSCFCASLFLSRFLFALLLCLCFMKTTTSKH